MTLLVGNVSVGFEFCPLCGQKRAHNSEIAKENQNESDKQQVATQPRLDDGSRG